MARVPADQRRRQFIDATIDVVAKHGVRGATTRQIAEAAGAPLASLHYCFSSKDELLGEVWETQTSAVVELVAEVPAGVGMGPAAVMIIETAAKRFVRHRNWSVCDFELEFWAQRHRASDSEIGWSYRRYQERVAEVLVRACRRREDPALAVPLSGLVTVILDGLAFQWFAYGDQDRYWADIARAGEMVERFVASRQSGSRRPRP